MAKGLVTSGIESAVEFEKSPATEGFMTGLKAALVGAPIGAGVQALRGKSPVLGAVLGAAIPGIIAGLAAATQQKLENVNTEAILRYHAENIKNREPMFFMPPPRMLGKYFSRRFEK